LIFISGNPQTGHQFSAPVCAGNNCNDRLRELIANCGFGFRETLNRGTSHEPAEDRFKTAFTIVTLEAGASTQKIYFRGRHAASRVTKALPSTTGGKGKANTVYRPLRIQQLLYPRCHSAFVFMPLESHTDPPVIWFCIPAWFRIAALIDFKSSLTWIG
jgi:hypothetical protein